MTQTVAIKSVLALDVGQKRIGIAKATMIAKLPNPLITVDNNDTVFDQLKSLVVDENAVAVVVGLPRNLQGDETEQTEQVKKFTAQLKQHIKQPIYFQDEALTSVKAEQENSSRKANHDVDQLAATYILSDWLADNKGYDA